MQKYDLFTKSKPFYANTPPKIQKRQSYEQLTFTTNVQVKERVITHLDVNRQFVGSKRTSCRNIDKLCKPQSSKITLLSRVSHYVITDKNRRLERENLTQSCFCAYTKVLHGKNVRKNCTVKYKFVSSKPSSPQRRKQTLSSNGTLF